MARFEVLCVGEAMVMLTDAGPVGPLLPATLSVHVGGAEANVARHLSAQGVRAAWMSRLGDDPFGRLVRWVLEGEGVDTSAVTVDTSAPTGLYYKERTADGGARAHYYRAGSAASELSPGDVGGLELARGSIVHTSGVLAAISPSAAGFVDALFAHARHAGATISFDVNFRPQLWRGRNAADALLALAQRADIVLVGRDEAESLWGTSTVDEIVALLSGPATVVVKDGDVAAVEVDRSARERRVTSVRPAPVDVVELVGAGDAFAGGYLAGYLRGEVSRARLARGHSAAAWTIGGIEDVRPGHQPAAFATTGDGR
ncbi:sugar kinase [Microbacterium sp. Marseille-Q6648]|uniref:sugar kinase n=1 Tax=Microbacterium sp. Marseille-Q6648 TaxID=2937991 RepID=UPI00203FE045|nr:sugar kinase [Microbacterium sp. Marseille-Q6648]